MGISPSVEPWRYSIELGKYTDQSGQAARFTKQRSSDLFGDTLNFSTQDINAEASIGQNSIKREPLDQPHTRSGSLVKGVDNDQLKIER